MTTDTYRLPVVTVSKRKLQGRRACWNAYQIDRDADGVWLYTPAGSTFRSSDGHHDEECEVEGGGGAGLDSLVLVPRRSSNWMATWHVPHPTPRYQCRDLLLDPTRRPRGLLRGLGTRPLPSALRTGRRRGPRRFCRRPHGRSAHGSRCRACSCRGGMGRTNPPQSCWSPRLTRRPPTCPRREAATASTRRRAPPLRDLTAGSADRSRSWLGPTARLSSRQQHAVCATRSAQRTIRLSKSAWLAASTDSAPSKSKPLRS